MDQLHSLVNNFSATDETILLALWDYCKQLDSNRKYFFKFIDNMELISVKPQSHSKVLPKVFSYNLFYYLMIKKWMKLGNILDGTLSN